MCQTGITTPPKKLLCPEKPINERWCKERNKKNVDRCVFDLCQGLSRRELIKIDNERKGQKKKTY